MDKPTEEERLGFVRSYGVEPVTDINTDLTFKDAAKTVAEFTPIIGDAMAAKEVYDELMKDEPNYGLIAALGGAALVGAVPGIGDAAAAGIRKAVDVAKRVEVDPDAVGMMGGNIRIKPKAEQGTPTVEAAGLTDEAIEKWRKENATSDEFRKALKGRNPELQEAAAGVKEGRVFTSTYRKLADDLRPIRKVTEVPKPATTVEVVSALNAGKRKSPIVDLNYSIPDGDQITARLDIDAYTDYDVWVPTLKHSGKTMYKPSVVLEDVKFIQPEAREVGKAMDVAVGPERLEADFGVNPKKGNKAPFAVMTGKYVEATDDEAYKLAQEVFDNPEFTQVGYDPTRRGFFYDRETGEAVVEADTVVQVGHLVLARNAKKMDAEAFPFNEGGIAMEEQMAMNFGDVPDNTIGIDPVSGNEIPLGSTAENVRDDIPVQLSEGEYVVPADVVRFYGVKFFEDLRAKAKISYNIMAQNGRIGGEPIEDEDDIGLDLSDLEIVEVQAMSEGGDAKGAYTFDNIKKKLVRKQAEDKPKFKNRFEEIMFNLFGRDSNDDPEPTRKATDKPKIDFGFGGNPMERASRKYGSPSSPTKNESYRPSSATQREVYKPKPNQPSIAEQIGFDEGGDTGPRVIDEGTTGQLLPDDFDPVLDSVGGGVMEMREYQNAAGHTLMIPFLNGVPQTVIPDGYFPVGSTPVVTPVNTAASGSRNDDDDDKKDITEPFNYKELTIDELTEEVKNLQETPNFLGTGIFSGIIAVAQKRHRNKLIQEIDRRLSNESFNNPNAEVFGPERSYLENLKEIAEAPPEKNMVGKLIDKLTGEETEKPDLPNLTDPTYEELPSIKEVGEAQVSEPYSPEPTSTLDNQPQDREPLKYIAPKREKSAAEKIQDSIFKKAAVDASREAAEKAFKRVSTPKPTPVSERSAGQREARQGTQDVLKSMRDRGASREERTEAVKEGARIENVRRDLDRGIMRGFEEGGLVEEKKVKEVVKGLKKASKLHAKQADTLEKTIKAKKKKSK